MRRWRFLLIFGALLCASFLVNLLLVYARSPYPNSPDKLLSTLEIQVNYADDWVAGQTDAWATVVVTVTDFLGEVREEAVITADGSGYYFVECDDWFSGWCPDIQPGDLIEVWSTGLLGVVDPVGTITGKLDSTNNTVEGILTTEALTGNLLVRCAVWADPGPSPIDTVADANGGSFSCDFDDVGWDLERGDTVAVSYYEPDGDQVINILEWPWTRVNYGHDWVGVNYDIGHTFWITVTDSLGMLKATGNAETVSRGGWDGPGFDYGDWSQQNPDIVPGDYVYVLSDDGYTNKLEVGQITGNLSVAADSINGTIFAQDFDPATVPTLPVECHPWGAWNAGIGDTPIKISSAAPDGSSPYSCDWVGDWDILPGQDIGVMYVEPDWDRVIDVYHEPAPYLSLDVQTQGEAGAGGNYLFQITYRNQGDALAEEVKILSTLSSGMNYLSDTSGFASALLGGGQIEWDLGSVAPGTSVSFDMFVEIIAGAGEGISNHVQITTSSLFDQGEAWEKEETWEGVVAENDTFLAIKKIAYTPDPAPGEALIFEVNICNQGSTGSNTVTMTDTLGSGMEIDTWWAQQAGWNEMSLLLNELVVSLPTVPGHDCRAVNLRALVDEGLPLGTPLTNTASIEASNDLDADNNLATWESQATEPHTNLRIEKWWNGGQLTPGGDIHYGIGYENTGNLPVGSFRITDTLPANTYFVSAWHNDPWGGYALSPIIVEDTYVVWEFPSLENGLRTEFDVHLQIDSNATVDQTLVNSVEVTHLPDEDTYEDNQAAWTEIIRDSGPNLRVKKWHNWEEDGHLSYQVSFENIGDEIFSDIQVIDTLPLDTAFSGNWDLQFDWDRFIELITTTQTLNWSFSELYPGEMGWLSFGTLLDEPGAPVHWYTNTIEITGTLTDIQPADNSYNDVAFSGGEIDHVGFWLDDQMGSIWGQAIAGSVITVNTPHTTLNAYADPACEGCWGIEDAGPILPGDEIEVEAGEALLPVVVTIPEPFTSQADSSTNIVSGEIGGWLSRPVSIYAEWLGEHLEVNSNASGGYVGEFADIPPAGRGFVQITDQVNYAEVVIQKPFRTLDLLLDVNYAHDWVEGLYEPGHTVWITATESDESTIKGLAELQSYAIPAWGGETGFSTIYDGWDGDHPDLQIGDWIFGEVDNGFSGAVRIGEISIEVDMDVDQVLGALYASWLGDDDVLLRCEIWSHPDAPGIEMMVNPKGGTYTCDFASEGWEIQPDQMIAVMYFTPEGHRVINIWETQPPEFTLYLPILVK